jgi:hypothetical protein
VAGAAFAVRVAGGVAAAVVCVVGDAGGAYGELDDRHGGMGLLRRLVGVWCGSNGSTC